MSTSTTTPVIGPDGRTYDAPYDQVPDMLRAGGQLGMDLVGPDNKTYTFPLDKVHAGLQGGATLKPPPMPATPTALPSPGERMTTVYQPTLDGAVPMQVPASQEQQFRQAYRQGELQGAKVGLTALGSAIAPEAVPEELGGSGALGYISHILARSAATGGGAATGTATGQALGGQNPLAPQNLREAAITGASTAALAGPTETVAALVDTKLARSMINQSVGATTGDVSYGNPARAISREGITNFSTGDWESYKDALRAGQTPDQAAQAAGGRFAAIFDKLSSLSQRVNNNLAQSSATLPVADIIDKPLDDAVIGIIGNRAMTAVEKDAAINQIGALQSSLKQGLGDDVSLVEAQKIKQQIGDRINWGGATAVTGEVKSAYKQVYGTIKDAINEAAPDTAALNERLTNLMAAKNDVETLAKAEEVGRGAGIARGVIGKSIPGMIEATAGRTLPGAAAAARGTRGVIGGGVSGVPVIGSLVTAIAEKQ